MPMYNLLGFIRQLKFLKIMISGLRISCKREPLRFVLSLPLKPKVLKFFYTISSRHFQTLSPFKGGITALNTVIKTCLNTVFLA